MATSAPTTAAPTTGAPVTSAPTTGAPTTGAPTTTSSPTTTSPTTYQLDSPPSNNLVVVTISLAYIMLGLMILFMAFDIFGRLLGYTGCKMGPNRTFGCTTKDWMVNLRMICWWVFPFWWSMTFGFYAAATGGAPYQTPVTSLYADNPEAKALLASAIALGVSPILWVLQAFLVLAFDAFETGMISKDQVKVAAQAARAGYGGIYDRDGKA